jgi:hypothetical protein
MPILTPDVWWHLATGRFVSSAGMPRTDPFSYTLAGRPWLAHEWLADRILFGANQHGGLLGIVFLRGALLVLSSALAYRLARRHAGVLPALTGMALAGWISQRNWLDRPQLWSFGLAPLAIWLLDRERSGARGGALALPFVFLLWVNLHGGFMLGLVLVLLWTLATAWEARHAASSPRIKRLVAIAGACVLATLANPHGIHGALYPLRYVGSGWRQTIQEEMPGALDSGFAWAHLALVLALLACFAVRWRRIALGERVTGLALAWVSMPRLGGLTLPLAAERHAPLFLFVGVPLLAWQAEAALGGRAAAWRRHVVAALRTPQAWAAGLAIAIGALAVAGGALPRESSAAARVLPGRFPEAGANWLAAHPLPGNLINPYRWGGYLTLRLWPKYSVWIDSRGDLYGTTRLREEELLYRMPAGSEPAVEALLSRYDANVIVWYFMTVDFGALQVHPFTRWLLTRPDWRLVFLDGPDPAHPHAPWATTGVFLRVDTRNAALLAALPPVPVPRAALR